MKTISLKNYSDEKAIINKIVIVDGIARSGKLLTGSLISSFKKMESLEFGENFEHFMSALSLKKCSNDFAKCYLINYLNQVIYNKMISRNINLRPNDITSVKNYYNPSQYKKRLNRGKEFVLNHLTEEIVILKTLKIYKKFENLSKDIFIHKVYNENSDNWISN